MDRKELHYKNEEIQTPVPTRKEKEREESGGINPCIGQQF
jgi:hypothetical protein